MSLVIPPGFGLASFVLTGSVGTPEFVTTLGVDTDAYSGDFVQCADDLMADFATAFGPATQAELTLDRVNLAVGQDGPGGSVDSTLAAIPMSRTGVQAPVAMSAIARKVTNDIGRRGRGRMFLPGSLNASEVDESGAILEARVDSLQADLDDFYQYITDTEGPFPPRPPVLLHSSAPTDPTPIVGFSVAPLVGWIRGRIR